MGGGGGGGGGGGEAAYEREMSEIRLYFMCIDFFSLHRLGCSALSHQHHPHVPAVPNCWTYGIDGHPGICHQLCE